MSFGATEVTAVSFNTSENDLGAYEQAKKQTVFAADWLGIKASGQKIRMRYMDFWRIEVDEESGESKLVENLVLIDILGVLEQCGYDINNVLKFIGSKPPEFFTV